jgi:hypothetical protein
MAELLHLSPAEVTAVRLSLRVAFWAMTTSLIPGVLEHGYWRAGGSGENRCSTGSFICRW